LKVFAIVASKGSANLMMLQVDCDKRNFPTKTEPIFWLLMPIRVRRSGGNIKELTLS